MSIFRHGFCRSLSLSFEWQAWTLVRNFKAIYFTIADEQIIPCTIRVLVLYQLLKASYICIRQTRSEQRTFFQTFELLQIGGQYLNYSILSQSTSSTFVFHILSILHWPFCYHILITERAKACTISASLADASLSSVHSHSLCPSFKFLQLELY